MVAQDIFDFARHFSPPVVLPVLKLLTDTLTRFSGRVLACALRKISREWAPDSKSAGGYACQGTGGTAVNYATDFKSVRSDVSEQEWQARLDLAACYRLVDAYGMTDLIYNHITARIPGTEAIC